MPFGRKGPPARNYSYGVMSQKGSPAGEAEALVQMRGRVTLWNNLVGLEREFAPRVQSYIQQACEAAGIQTLSAGDWNALNTAERAALTVRRKAVLQQEEHVAALSVLEHERQALVKAKVQEAGLFWLNSEPVVVAYEQARRGPGELKFHSWYRSIGVVSVRYQHGLPVSKAFSGTDTRFGFVRDLAHRERPGRRLLEARIRVNSDDKGKPVWLHLPVILHRPLPQEGVIQQVQVFRERIGFSVRWRIMFTVREPQRNDAPDVSGRPTVAIDLGWRRFPGEGIRVAAWHDSTGAQGEVRLSERWFTAWDLIERLRSHRQVQFNAARDALAAWLSASPQVPEHLRNSLSHLHSWLNPSRLYSVVWQWKDQRFPGDEVGYSLAETWRQRDRHLGEWEAHQRRNLLDHRLDVYRNFAAKIARTYGSVHVEDFDLRPVAEVRTDRAKGKELPAPARRGRFYVAPSIFRLALKNACGREGVPVRVVPAAYSTQQCAYCGAVEDFDAAKQLWHQCTSCGTEWDQDDNAALVLLAR